MRSTWRQNPGRDGGKWDAHAGALPVVACKCKPATREPGDETEELAPGNLGHQRRVPAHEVGLKAVPLLLALMHAERMGEVAGHAEIEVRPIQLSNQRLSLGTGTRVVPAGDHCQPKCAPLDLPSDSSAGWSAREP